MDWRTGKGFVTGVLTTALLFGAAGTAYSAVKEAMIPVSYHNIKIMLDGKELEPKDPNGNAVEPFIYEGTTYLPLRAVAEALGKDVVWDGENYVVGLNTKAEEPPKEEQPPVVPAEGYSRNNPAPLGVAQKLSVANSGTEYDAIVTMSEIIDGQAAWELLHDANAFNKEPGEGKKYILAKFHVKVENVCL